MAQNGNTTRGFRAYEGTPSVKKAAAFREFGVELQPAISTASWFSDSPRELIVSLWKHNFSTDFSSYSDEIAHWNSPGGVKFKRDVAQAKDENLPVRVVLAETDQEQLVRAGRAREAQNDYAPRPDMVGQVIHISNDRVVFAFEVEHLPSQGEDSSEESIPSASPKEARYWRVVEAVKALGGGTLAEVVSWLDQRYPGDPLGNARADLELLTVNSPSRPHFNTTRKDWHTSGAHRHDQFFKVIEHGPPRRATYTIFDPAIHGHVDLRQSSEGKWVPILLPLSELDQAAAEGRAQATLPPIDSDHDSRVWAMKAIAQRQGQYAFRTLLLDAYERRCAVTGSTATHVLEAAHIRPYRGEHTNRADNGLLLRSDLHTLFDLGLIWVEGNRLVVANGLKGTDYEPMHGIALRLPRDPSLHPNPAHLADHARLARERHGLGEANA